MRLIVVLVPALLLACGGRSSLLAGGDGPMTAPPDTQTSPQHELPTVPADAFAPDRGGPHDLTVPDSSHPVYSVEADGLGRAITVDLAGNTYIAGHITNPSKFGSVWLSHAGMKDVFVAKLSATGQFLWARSMGGTDLDTASGIAYSASANALYVAGTFQKTASFGVNLLTTSAVQAAFVARIDPSNGDVAWVVQAGGPLFNDTGRLDVSPQGAPLLVGTFEGVGKFGGFVLPTKGQYDIFVTRLTATGKFSWATSAGGAEVDDGRAITSDGGGGAWIAGSFQKTASFGAIQLESTGQRDAFVAYVADQGNIVSAVAGGGFLEDAGEYIVRAASGTAILGGFARAPAKFGEMNIPGAGVLPFLAVIEPAGSFKSLSMLDTPPSAWNHHVWGIAAVNAKDHLALWSGGTNANLSRLTASGALKWTRVCGTTAAAAAMAVDSLGYVITATGNTTTEYTRFKPDP